MNDQQAQQLSETHQNVKRLILVVDGDPSLDIEGLRPRVDRIEETQQTILEERDRLVNYVRGGLIGLGLNVGGLLALIYLVWTFMQKLGAG